MFVPVQRCIRQSYTLYRCVHSQYLNINDSNGTREIILNHQKTKNSLSMDMMTHLIEAINSNKEDKSLRAIVLSAQGNVFSAGHNLKELQSSTGVDQHKLIFRKASELMKSIVESPVPVIAKVNGFAAAAGCQLVATCDMVVCSDISKFSTPGANFGVFCSTPGIAVARSVPKSRATYMLFTGEPITAQEAYESGLVTKVVSANELDNEVIKIIEKIKHKSRSIIALGKQFFYKQIDLSEPITAQEAYESGLVTKVVSANELDNEVIKIIEKIKHKSRSIIALGKQFFYKQIDLSLFEAYQLGEEIMVKNINSNDGQEGIRSFVEKRKANWQHK